MQLFYAHSFHCVPPAVSLRRDPPIIPSSCPKQQHWHKAGIKRRCDTPRPLSQVLIESEELRLYEDTLMGSSPLSAVYFWLLKWSKSSDPLLSSACQVLWMGLKCCAGRWRPAVARKSNKGRKRARSCCSFQLMKSTLSVLCARLGLTAPGPVSLLAFSGVFCLQFESPTVLLCLFPHLAPKRWRKPFNCKTRLLTRCANVWVPGSVLHHYATPSSLPYASF